MSKVLIRFVHIDKAFGSQQVCTDFNLDIYEGETLCIVGPSGCGKTVTIKMLIGLVDFDGGELWFDGVNVGDFRRDEDFLAVRRRVAMVFQSSALFDSMSVFDNVAYPLREFERLSEDELEARVLERLDWVGLKDAGAKFPAELSGGMKKRVGLARAIVTNPEVILYDEPTTGLDPVTTVRIADLIATLKQKIRCTSVVVTHDISVAEKLSDRMAFMYQGKIRAIGSFDELKTSTNPVVRGYLQGDPDIMEGTTKLSTSFAPTGV